MLKPLIKSYQVVAYLLVLCVLMSLVLTYLFTEIRCSSKYVHYNPNYITFTKNTSWDLNENSTGEIGLEEGDDKNRLPQKFLFVGVLSKGSYQARRTGCRLGWVESANKRNDTLVKFILSESEMDSTLRREEHQFGDITAVPRDYGGADKVGYRDIFIKVVYIFTFALRNVDFKFVLKTDDDAFINVPGLIKTCEGLCKEPSCQDERLYIGHMFENAKVISNPKDKWYGGEYINHTALYQYPPYAQGGGYLLTKVLIEDIVYLFEKQSLVETPIEDANIGFWLTSIRNTRHDLPTFWAWGNLCCGRRSTSSFRSIQSYADWKNIVRKQNMPPARVICPLKESDQALVLHKITSPQLMQTMGKLFQACYFVRQFQQNCLGGDVNSKQITCDKIDIWDLCLLDSTYLTYCTQLSTKKKDYKSQFSDKLSTLKRPFNVTDVDRIFKEFRREYLPPESPSCSGDSCKLAAKSPQTSEKVSDITKTWYDHDNIRVTITKMMESLKKINQTGENPSTLMEMIPALEVLQKQLSNEPIEESSSL